MQSRLLGILLFADGLAFALFPPLRPWGDKTGVLGEQSSAFSDPLWVASHVVGMLAWVLLSFALLVHGTLRDHRADKGSTRPSMSAWLALAGTMLLLPYYGAETFGLHGIAASGGEAATHEAVDAAQDAIRNGISQSVLFSAGFVLWSIATIRVAFRERSWPAGLIAGGVVTYLPQFFLAPELRIAHGVVLGAGCILWGLERGRNRRKAKGRNHVAPA
ncbi:hypothetical protein [Corynebacterium ulceribovis]|uniref:hypothetical protein n=1 Tax=Corynebacterium ulceribovis TaxID=487732 RepID=UPI00035CCCF2|nr:hypothetical protein [Corynebacterium ulceribovis]